MIVFKVIRARPRFFAAVACGVASFFPLPTSLAPLTRGLIAWDIGCLLFLVLSAALFSSERDSTMADDAAAQQEGEWTVFWLIVGALLASFAAVIGEFSASKDVSATLRGLRGGLVAATLVLSWLMTQTMFALRYAHEYYSAARRGGPVDRGLDFPGEDNPDYWDFFYFALVLGMTFQVSDVQVTSRKLRRLAAAHGFLAFLFNTVILALSVNLGASLL